jgi:uncharacterized protein (TIGR00255 family)
MIRSMTGFGKATGCINGCTVTVEVSSVNHRFLDANFRMPGEWAALDPVLRETVKNHLNRGKVYINVSRKREPGASSPIRLDTGLARQYATAARELAELVGSNEPLSVNTLAQFSGVFVFEENVADMEVLGNELAVVLEEALRKLDAMRAVEGEMLRNDLLVRIESIVDTVKRIETRLPNLNEGYTDRLRARVTEIAGDTQLAEERIAIEIAILADKGDVTEEIVRLRSHLEHAAELLRGQDPAGRQLNFLTQELQREMNTLGSKVRDTDVVRGVLEMKAELERIREQIQNIE